MDRIISFCYRKIIDTASSRAWERLVFEDSYTEFKMQAQRFNERGRYSSFAEMLHNNSAAEQLHFLTAGTAAGYVKQLHGKIPDILNTLGKQFLSFKNFRFEIINSDIKDISKHKVAINFFSEEVIWICSAGDVMILSLNEYANHAEQLTETFIMPPFVSIYSIKKNGK